MTAALYITWIEFAAYLGACFVVGYAIMCGLRHLVRRRRSHPVETITGLPDTELNRRRDAARKGS